MAASGLLSSLLLSLHLFILVSLLSTNIDVIFIKVQVLFEWLEVKNMNDNAKSEMKDLWFRKQAST